MPYKLRLKFFFRPGIAGAHTAYPGYAYASCDYIIFCFLEGLPLPKGEGGIFSWLQYIILSLVRHLILY